MSSLTKLLGAGAATIALSTALLAAPISGVLNFNGSAALVDAANAPTTNLANATAVGANGFSAVNVQNVSNGSTLDGSVNPGDVVTMTSTQWNFNGSGLPIGAFWSVGTFSFTLNSSQVVNQNSSFLNVTGTGVLTSSVAGQDPTPYNWSFTIPTAAANGVFSFSAGNTPVPGVPDGGTTAIMLGLGMVALTAVARRLKKA